MRRSDAVHLPPVTRERAGCQQNGHGEVRRADVVYLQTTTRERADVSKMAMGGHVDAVHLQTTTRERAPYVSEMATAG